MGSVKIFVQFIKYGIPGLHIQHWIYLYATAGTWRATVFAGEREKDARVDSFLRWVVAEGGTVLGLMSCLEYKLESF